MSIAPFWTADEIAKLREIWPKGRQRKASLLAAFPGRTWSGIVQKARSEKIEHPGFARWTSAEDAILIAHYPLCTRAEICAKLPRHSGNGIEKRAVSFGVRRDKAKLQSEFVVIRELRRIRRTRNVQLDMLAKRFASYGSTLSAWEIGMQVPNLRGVPSVGRCS